jgi:hypothetical protein
MIRKSGNRFFEKIMLHQKDRAPNRFNLKPSRSKTQTVANGGNTRRHRQLIERGKACTFCVTAIAVRMITKASTVRLLGPWFLGLFVIAQIFGIIPLVSGHTAHVAETEFILAAGTDGNVPQGHHHRGDADGFLQHHELQDLSGVPACPASGCDIASFHAVMVTCKPRALTAIDPILLERPPKHLLSI